MSRVTITPSDVPNFYGIVHTKNNAFANIIRLGIKPLSYRQYDNSNKRWLVHEKKIPFIVSVAEKMFQIVDLRELPPEIEKEIFSRKPPPQRNPPLSPTMTSSYRTLHLLPTAPSGVVKAAYRALVSIHHPDKGGDEKKFCDIQSAYEKILSSSKNIH